MDSTTAVRSLLLFLASIQGLLAKDCKSAIADRVGWVERSETQRLSGTLVRGTRREQARRRSS